MASITQRGGRFFVRVRQQGFPCISKTFQRKADAAAWARRTEADMEAGRWVAEGAATGRPTLAQAVREYRVVVASKMKGAATYVYRFNEFEALAFASKPIDMVTPRDLAMWRDEGTTRLKPATVVRSLAMMSAIFGWAMRERGWIKSNPASMITWPKVVDRRERLLSGDEQRYMLAAAETSKARWLSDALIVLMNSAMRRGELFGLRLRDVNFETAVAHLADTKNGRPRDVPLCPASLAALRALADASPKRPDSPFLPLTAPGSVSTRFIATIRRARRAYEDDCNAANVLPDDTFLTDVRLHDQRHAAITKWANTGALSVMHLQAISGHTSPVMLARYTHLTAAGLAARMAQIAGETA